MQYFLQGLGVAVGLIGGIIVWIIYHLWARSRGEKILLRNVAFEFRMNIKQIDTLLDELNKCRTAVGAQTLRTYLGYFDLSRCNWIATSGMFSSGLIYKHFKEGDIDKLLGMFPALRVEMSDYMNRTIRDYKEATAPRIAERVISNIDFWEKKFKDHKKELEEMMKKLIGKKQNKK